MTTDGVEFGEVKVMGDIINPVEGNSFVDLVEAKDTRIFVDKTEFINRTNALLNTDGKLLSLTRPRRFGKTVTADMLLAYYSKEYDGQKIFDNLKITNNEYKASYEKLTDLTNGAAHEKNTIIFNCCIVEHCLY